MSYDSETRVLGAMELGNVLTLMKPHRTARRRVIQIVPLVVVTFTTRAVYRHAEVRFSIGTGVRTQARDTYLNPFVCRSGCVGAGVDGGTGCGECWRDECKGVWVWDREGVLMGGVEEFLFDEWV